MRNLSNQTNHLYQIEQKIQKLELERAQVLHVIRNTARIYPTQVSELTEDQREFLRTRI